jgi:hypothetical protein
MYVYFLYSTALLLTIMSGQLKNSLLLLASVAFTLSACNRVNVESRNIEGNRSEPIPQVTTPVKSPLPIVTPTPVFSQDKSKAKTSTANVQVNRENYKPMALTQLTKSEALIGDEPKAIAQAAFGDVDSEGGSRDVKVEYPQPDRAVVIITQTGVADDSVRAIRYRAELVPTSKSQTGKQWKIVWAGSQFTCQPGRGHQDWSIKLCS